MPIPLSSYEYKLRGLHIKRPFFFGIGARKICEMFVYKHSEAIEYVKN